MAAEPAPVEVLASPVAYVQLRFVEVGLELPSTNPVVRLEELDPPGRVLSIPIGLPEGVAIACAAKGLETPRPLTHELTTALLEAFGLTVELVRITAVSGTSFSCEIVVSGPTGTSRTFPCRTSDAIALALRQRLFVPVVAAPAVLEAAGTSAVEPAASGGAERSTEPGPGAETTANDDDAGS